MDYDDKAPGFRFYPTEEELISFYLQQKLEGRMQEDLDQVIPALYIYDYNPWDLPEHAGEGCKSDPQLKEWFFFIPRNEREARGGRPNRLTTYGYWKATGSPGFVYSSHENHRIIGLKRTMVFHRGQARNRRSGPGTKTEWKMNEYMAIDLADQPPSVSPATAVTKGEYSVCRLYERSKMLRAFDRRPGAPPTAGFRPIASSSHEDIEAPDHHEQLPTSSGHHDQHQPRSTPSSSGDHQSSTSSGGDHGNDDANVDLSLGENDQENNIGMDNIIGQTPHWDYWDSFNWSCLGMN